MGRGLNEMGGVMYERRHENDVSLHSFLALLCFLFCFGFVFVVVLFLFFLGGVTSLYIFFSVFFLILRRKALLVNTVSSRYLLGYVWSVTFGCSIFGRNTKDWYLEKAVQKKREDGQREREREREKEREWKRERGGRDRKRRDRPTEV